MTEQHLPSYQRDFNSEVEQFRDIAARFKRSARHCFKSKVQRFRDIVERLEDSTKERVRLYSLRRWRTARIERFTKIQRDKREWISFAEIAEYCSEESGVVPNEVARETAYEKLLADLLEGDFEENGRSQVLYLHPYTTKARMTREWLIGLLEFKDADRATIISQYLANCWMRRVFVERWLAKYRMEPRPQRFEPKRQTPSATTQPSVSQVHNTVTQPVIIHTVSDPPRKRRYGPESGTLRRYEDADRALFPELERIMVEEQKSRSAAALELAQAGEVKGFGTAQSRGKRLAKLHGEARHRRGPEAAGDPIPADENENQNPHN
jgi:hypothetical protein